MAVELDHPFTTAKPIDESFATILDLERVVPCVEGGNVLETTGPDAVRAEIKVKMAAMSMTFTGTVEIVEQDAEAHRPVTSVKSQEAGGQGHANATVEFALTDGGGNDPYRRADHGQGRVDGRGSRRRRAGRADHGFQRQARCSLTGRSGPRADRCGAVADVTSSGVDPLGLRDEARALDMVRSRNGHRAGSSFFNCEAARRELRHHPRPRARGPVRRGRDGARSDRAGLRQGRDRGQARSDVDHVHRYRGDRRSRTLRRIAQSCTSSRERPADRDTRTR